MAPYNSLMPCYTDMGISYTELGAVLSCGNTVLSWMCQKKILVNFEVIKVQKCESVSTALPKINMLSALCYRASWLPTCFPFILKLPQLTMDHLSQCKKNALRILLCFLLGFARAMEQHQKVVIPGETERCSSAGKWSYYHPKEMSTVWGIFLIEDISLLS